MMTTAIIVISVIAYLIAGIAAAVIAILVDGEPEPGDQAWILCVVMFWPILTMITVPLALARSVKARREASRAKPRAFSEELD